MTIAINTNATFPVVGSSFNPVKPSIVIQLDNSVPLNSFDLNSITVTMDVYTSAGIVRETAFDNGKPKSGYAGNITIVEVQNSNPALTTYNLKCSFKRNANLPYNLPVSVAISGKESPTNIPFSFAYTFTTLVLKDKQPPASTPAKTSPVNDAHIDQPIAYIINSNPEWFDTTDPLYSSKHLSVIDKTTLTISVTVGSNPPDLVIVGGIVNPTSQFTLNLSDIASGAETGVVVTLTPKYYYLPYGTIVNIDTSGIMLLYTPLPSTVPFSQSLNFETQLAPLQLNSLSNTSLNYAKSTYNSVKEDGAVSVFSYTGAGITVVTTPNPAVSPASSTFLTKLVDTVNSPFTSDLLDTIVNLNVVPPYTSIETKIKSFISTSEVELDFYNRPNFPLSPIPVVSYSLENSVVQSTLQTKTFPSSGGDPGTQVQNGLNGMFVTLQAWAQKLGAFRSRFFSKDFLPPSSSDWPVTSEAAEDVDPNNSGLSIRIFPTSTLSGIGFYLDVPDNAGGLSISLRGRAASILVPSTNYYVGFSLYYRSIKHNTPVSSWSLPYALDNVKIPASSDYQYNNQTIIFSPTTLPLLPGTLYQCELVRTIPTGGFIDLPDDFYLLNAVFDFG